MKPRIIKYVHQLLLLLLLLLLAHSAVCPCGESKNERAKNVLLADGGHLGGHRFSGPAELDPIRLRLDSAAAAVDDGQQ